MKVIEGMPAIEPVGQAARLTLPCSKHTQPTLKDYQLTRAQLTALIASGIETLDKMDEAQASAADNVIRPAFSNWKVTA
jgi:hypothetical protein